MDASKCFATAKKWDSYGSGLFAINTFLSFGLIFVKNTKSEPYLAFPLCALVFVSLFLTLWSRYWINKGNGARRVAQFADAFGVACDHPAREGYYNNSLQPGLRRLLATTGESSGLTREILEEMVREKIFKLAGFVVIFLCYIGYWRADSNIVAVIAQALFSGDLVGNLVNSLRYSWKVQRAHDSIITLFRTRADFDDPHTLAIGLSAHVDYECAKEEAGILLDSKIYDRKNPDYTRRWDRLRGEFKIDSQ